jgi:4'-phosphopantetheinyl transferase EntD
MATILLSDSLDSLLPQGAVGAVRPIEFGDEAMLTSSEVAAMRESVLTKRRASGAARAIARRLLASLGVPAVDILRSPGGAPVWPTGYKGSLSHDATMAAATVAPSKELGGIGVDVETAEPLDAEVMSIVGSVRERRTFCRDHFDAKLLFSIKEAVFKATNPMDRVFLEFRDVTVDREKQIAITSYDRLVHWRAIAWPHVIAVAWW